MPGGRLTDEERRYIAAGLADRLGYAEIGRQLGRPASTVLREVTRNGGRDGYRADRAQQATRRRARRRRPAPPHPPIPDTSPGRDPREVQEFVESFTALLVQQGLPRMEARVLTCLYVTDSGTLTAAELVQRLRVSPASISHAVAFLEGQGILRREHPTGHRRERYVVDDEIWLRSTLAAARMNDTLAAASLRGAEVLGPTTPAGVRFGVSAELLTVVGDAIRNAMQTWQHRPAGADGRRPG